MTPLRIFLGADHRQPISLHVAMHSIMVQASVPISITPLIYKTLPIPMDVVNSGLTPFTHSRALVPWLCGFEGGPAIFMDADVLVRCDIADLLKFHKPENPVTVRKSAPRFEWSAVMVFEPSHPMNRCLVPSTIGNMAGLNKCSWVGDDDQIGELPPEYHQIVLYDEPREDAKIVHFTGGVPGFHECEHHEHSVIWQMTAEELNRLDTWVSIMGRSVHAKKVKASYLAEHGEGSWEHEWPKEKPEEEAA